MDLNDLKKTWDKLASPVELNENQIREMLHKRTKSLMDRIERNIRIGFIVLFVLIVMFILDDFIFSPILIREVGQDFSLPGWLLFLSIFSNALICTTFIFFVIKYNRVRKTCQSSCNLRETLVKIIDTLKIYQRMFYLALFTLVIAMGTGFVSGMYEGFAANIQEKGVAFSEIQTRQVLLTVLIGLVFLVILVGAVFLFLRWGFRRLYGNYIEKLKHTLSELDEIE